MTKREYEKYYLENKRDPLGNTLKVGDLVAFVHSYYREVHLGKIKHFTREGNICIEPLKIDSYTGNRYCRPCSIIKVDLEYINSKENEQLSKQ